MTDIDAEAERDALRAENERLRKLAKWAYETLHEINPSNYDHDDVCAMNDASVEVILAIYAALQQDNEKEKADDQNR